MSNIIILSILAFSIKFATPTLIDPSIVQQFVQECGKATNTPPAEYNSQRVLFDAPSKNLQCFAKCFLERLEVINSDGAIQKDVLTDYIKQLPKELETELLRCSDEIGTITECETIEKLRDCLLPTLEKIANQKE